MSKQKLIVIVGPTASGKTSLAIKLAKRFNGEIISADSRQIYRGMDIGTAKPPILHATQRGASAKSSAQTSQRNVGAAAYSHGVPHYCIDIKNPDQPYTVAEYKRDAIRAIRGILRRDKLPILSGGTDLYVRTVTENLDIPAVKPDLRLRKKLEQEIRKRGLRQIFEKLLVLDPEAAYIVDPKNPRRIIRTLEIALLTKKPFSAQRKRGKPLFEVLEIGVFPPKEKLRERINRRVDEMIKDGLINEVKNLIGKYGVNQPAFDAIGYREIIDYLNGKIALERAVELIKKNTWHYAKRQLTWFRKDKEIKWIKNERQALRLTEGFLE